MIMYDIMQVLDFLFIQQVFVPAYNTNTAFLYFSIVFHDIMIITVTENYYDLWCRFYCYI